jgi:hypothetical protein
MAGRTSGAQRRSKKRRGGTDKLVSLKIFVACDPGRNSGKTARVKRYLRLNEETIWTMTTQ